MPVRSTMVAGPPRGVKPGPIQGSDQTLPFSRTREAGRIRLAAANLLSLLHLQPMLMPRPQRSGQVPVRTPTKPSARAQSLQ